MRIRLQADTRGLFALDDMLEGQLLGRMSGDILYHSECASDVEEFMHRAEHGRVVSVRHGTGWAAVDVSCSVFAFARSVGVRVCDVNLNVSQTGWVSCDRDVHANEELMW